VHSQLVCSQHFQSINLVDTYTKQKPRSLSQIMFKQSLSGSNTAREMEAQSMNSHPHGMGIA
jgi:hypothetical protein